MKGDIFYNDGRIGIRTGDKIIYLSDDAWVWVMDMAKQITDTLDNVWVWV